MSSKVKVSGGIDDFLNRGKKYAQEVARRAAGKIRDDLTETAKSAIEQFYDNYSPKEYDRTYNLKNNSFKKYYRNSHGKRYSGGVEFTPDAMMDVYNLHVPYYVMYVAVWGGIHGLVDQAAEGITPMMRPTPIEIVLKKREEIYNNIDNYINFAKSGVNI